jgi:hypothetical protein
LSHRKNSAIEKIQLQLNSQNSEQRQRAWNKLRDLWVITSPILGKEDLGLLMGCLERETDPDAFRAGLMAMILYPRQTLVNAPVPGTPIMGPVECTGMSLIEWLWLPFQRSSLIFSTAGTQHQLRDETCEFTLGRRLCYDRCHDLELVRFPLDNVDWQHRISDGKIKAVCILGRLGLYGPDAVHDLSMPHSHFQFPINERLQENECPDQVENYRCIREFVAGGVVDHVTNLSNGIGKDYSIVQRHTIILGQHKIALVVCAGTSSLGTLAATQWATKQLAQSTHFSGDLQITTPKSTTVDSRMEALLEVTAKKMPHGWVSTQVVPKKLFMDNHAWQPELQTWEEVSNRCLEIVHTKGEPSSVLLDGQLVPQRKNSQGFSLLIEMATQKYVSTQSEIDIKQLAANPNIWEGATVTPSKVLKSLTMLKTRFLRSSLELGSNVFLHPEVRLIHK